MTVSDGTFQFSGVGPGTYTVREELQTGWVQTSTPTTYSITTASGTNVSGNVFGNFQLVTIGGTVFNDVNGDGAQELGDGGLQGWTVDLIQGQNTTTTTTGSDGSFSFSGIGPGMFTVKEVVQPGWVQTTTPTTYSVTTISGTNSTGNVFGNFQTVTISGTVFKDVNGNGIQEMGDLGLSMWAVDLFKGQTLVKSVLTGTDGSFSFTGIQPGAYTVQEELEPGWLQTTTPTAYSVTTSSGTNVSGEAFGNFQMVSISGLIFNDLNGDGIQQSGDGGLNMWTVDLVGSSTAKRMTVSDGTFQFSGVGPGTYTVREELQTGWVQTSSPTTYSVTTASGTNVSGNVFGDFQLGTLGGTVFEDLTGNGFSADDPPLSSSKQAVTVNLFLNGGGTPLTSVPTDTNGNYTFSNLGPGSYTVQETVPTGWQLTAQTGATTVATSGFASSGNNFDDFKFVTISGTVFNDLNGDGTQESGELGLSGWTVDLIQGQNTIKATTAADGSFSFSGVGPGTFTVQEELQAGWVQTSTPTTYPVTTASGTNVTGNVFGNFQTVMVSGTVFNDLNDNHVQDSGEPGLNGVTINLDGIAAATTNAQGIYTISNVGPGSHTVSEVIPTAYIATAPASGSTSFTATEGVNPIANFADALPTQTLDNGQTGYQEVGSGWTTFASGWNGTSRIHSATQSKSVSASWFLTTSSGLPAGTYEVFITYVPDPSRTTVRYLVYDNNKLRGKVTVDQTQTPVNGTYQAVVWKSLGIFQIKSGKLTVRMQGTTTDATKTMDADGVLLIPDGSAKGQTGPASSLVGRDATTGNWWVGASNGSTAFTNEFFGNWNPMVTWVNVVSGDFNGDGQTDMAGRDLQSGNWWVSMSNGSGFTNQLWGGWNPAVTWVDVQVGDFTGNGLDDIVGRDAATGNWWVAESTGSSFVNTPWGNWSTKATWVDVKVGDFNGDGRADITGRYLQGGAWWTSISTGSSFTTTMWAAWNPAATWVNIQVADFNGDGKDDIAGRYLQGGQWYVGVSTGSSFATAPWSVWNPHVSWINVQVGDFNGDGKMDLIGQDQQSGNWWVAQSTGSSFTNSFWTHWNQKANWTNVMVADVNADGLDDLVGMTSSGQWWASISNGNNFINTMWGGWNPNVTWVDVHNGIFS
jgi:hypothetical protein